LKQVNLTSEAQFPFATILSCIDSRTSAELLFDQGLGDILSIRIAGNVLNDDILGSMEYACHVVRSKIIVVLGHTKCGAITCACDDYKLGYLTGLVEKIRPAIEEETDIGTLRNGSNLRFVNNVSKIHVAQTIEQIRRSSALLCEMEQEGTILIVGALYDLDTGVVTFFED
jgi:carbonic anhydrase